MQVQTQDSYCRATAQWLITARTPHPKVLASSAIFAVICGTIHSSELSLDSRVQKELSGLQGMSSLGEEL